MMSETPDEEEDTYSEDEGDPNAGEDASDFSGTTGSENKTQKKEKSCSLQ